MRDDFNPGRTLAPVDVQSLVNILQSLGVRPYIAARTAEAGIADTAPQETEAGGLGLSDVVARDAHDAAQRVAGDAAHRDVLIVDRSGAIVGESD